MLSSCLPTTLPKPQTVCETLCKQGGVAKNWEFRLAYGRLFCSHQYLFSKVSIMLRGLAAEKLQRRVQKLGVLNSTTLLLWCFSASGVSAQLAIQVSYFQLARLPSIESKHHWIQTDLHNNHREEQSQNNKVTSQTCKTLSWQTKVSENPNHVYRHVQIPSRFIRIILCGKFFVSDLSL